MSDLFVDNIKHQSSQGSGTITLGASGETVNVPTGVTTTLTDGVSGDFKMNSGFGSVATAYACRSWVNFNGTGTVAIRDSGNVTSISDLGVGDYQVNFTTAMPDVNYSVIITKTWAGISGVIDSYNTTNCRIISGYVTSFAGGASSSDPSIFNVAIFR